MSDSAATNSAPSLKCESVERLSKSLSTLFQPFPLICHPPSETVAGQFLLLLHPYQLHLEDQCSVWSYVGSGAVLLVGELRWNKELPFRPNFHEL